MARTPKIKWTGKHLAIGAGIVGLVYYWTRHTGHATPLVSGGRTANPTMASRYTDVVGQADTSRYVNPSRHQP